MGKKAGDQQFDKTGFDKTLVCGEGTLGVTAFKSIKNGNNIIKTESMIDNAIEIEKAVLRGPPPEPFRPDRVTTEGRFNMKLPNNGVLYKKDRALLKKKHPKDFEAQEK